LPAALARIAGLWRCGIARGDRFAVAYLGATFLFFTLAGSRRSYYLLPVLPAGALVVARQLTVAPSELSAMTRRLVAIACFLITIAVGLVGAALLPSARLLLEPWKDLPPLPAATEFALGWFCCFALSVWGWCRSQSGRVAVIFGTIAVLSMGYLHLIALPILERYRGDKEFAARVRLRLGDDLAGLALYQTREPVFYLASPRPIPEFDSPDVLPNAVRRDGICWVIGRSRDLAALGPVGTVIDAEPTQPWEDKTARGNKLQLVRLESAAIEP
jgi:hypothetical protein